MKITRVKDKPKFASGKVEFWVPAEINQAVEPVVTCLVHVLFDPPLAVKLPAGWTGPHYRNDGREFIQGPKNSGIGGSGSPIKFTGRRVGKEIPINALHEFHPFRERLAKRRKSSEFGGFVIISGVICIEMSGGTQMYWSEKVQAFEAAREDYERKKQEILDR